jgi:carbonic anhydrase
MPATKRNVLYVRCSDGRSRRPEEIREHCVHQIREPGGILSSIFYAKHLGRSVNDYEEVLAFKIAAMVQLKAPDEIIVASHAHCGAAEDIGLTNEEVAHAHLEFGRKLQERFPHIKVRALHEQHSECGEHHHGHVDLSVAA